MMSQIGQECEKTVRGGGTLALFYLSDFEFIKRKEWGGLQGLSYRHVPLKSGPPSRVAMTNIMMISKNKSYGIKFRNVRQYRVVNPSQKKGYSSWLK